MDAPGNKLPVADAGMGMNPRDRLSPGWTEELPQKIHRSAGGKGNP